MVAPGLTERQLTQEPEDCEGENADVDAGNNQNVIRAGALEVGLDIASKESAAADQGCLHQRAPFPRPQLHDMSQRTAPGRVAPKANAAADETGQHFNIAGAR